MFTDSKIFQSQCNEKATKREKTTMCARLSCSECSEQATKVQPLHTTHKEPQRATGNTVLDDRLALSPSMMMPPSFSLLLLLISSMLRMDPSSGFQVLVVPSHTARRPITNRPLRIPRMRLTVKDDDDNKEDNDTRDPSSRGRPTPSKFTGAGSSSSPLFSQDSAPPARNNDNSNDDSNNPYEREINLASAFERTLGLQALGLLAALVFVLYVGFTGGITDGSERYNYGEDDILMTPPMEEVMRREQPERLSVRVRLMTMMSTRACRTYATTTYGVCCCDAQFALLVQ